MAGWGNWARPPGSLVPEEFTLDDFVHEGANTVIALARAIEDAFELRALGEAHGLAGGVGHELFRERAGDRTIVGEEKLLELAHVLKRPSVGELASRIDLERVMKREALAVQAHAGLGRNVFLHRAVAVTPPAHD